ncbi:hypothetical protein PNOK_0171200 [Pyrrhoderma noxium]|uniref:Uncharacterized protein n=1 Tax=Pyrrhoderma noxium TaxID=2282107 RepID=A0A286UQK2_9AGAM|nr:hypothetical protein PNOK_0171200 [Pyrrhoderma noxium]
MPNSSSTPSSTFNRPIRPASEPTPLSIATRNSISTSKALPSASSRINIATRIRRRILPEIRNEIALKQKIEKDYPNGRVTYLKLRPNNTKAWAANFSCEDVWGMRVHAVYGEHKEDVAKELLQWLEYYPISPDAEKYKCISRVLHPDVGGKTFGWKEDEAIQHMYQYLTKHQFGTVKPNECTPKLSEGDFELWKDVLNTARYKYNSQILFNVSYEKQNIVECQMKMVYHIFHTKIVVEKKGAYAFGMAVRAMHARMKASAHDFKRLDFSGWKP